MDLNRDKALRSDGFSLAFWKDCWELVKKEILCFFREFFFFLKGHLCEKFKLHLCGVDSEERRS